jgi:Uma2 family endonuclease
VLGTCRPGIVDTSPPRGSVFSGIITQYSQQIGGRERVFDMSMTTAAPQVPTSPPEVFPGLYRFSVAQYDRMVHDGTIGKNERVELIEGLLVTKMGKNPPHVFAGKLGLKRLERLVSPGWHVGKEDPVVVSEWGKPEPDLSVVRGTENDYLHRAVTAADVGLVVEIAESSLATDRSVMTKIYARAGIPVYWIVNLVDRQIEVYTQPSDDEYQSRQDFALDQDVPVVIDGREIGRIPVSDIVP